MRTTSSRVTIPALIVLAATAVIAAGCTMAVEPVATKPAEVAGAEPTEVPVKATPLPTPDIVAVANDAMFGKWRRAPAQTTPLVRETAEAACREQAAVGDLPIAVLDARGEAEVTIVFADADKAAVCFVTADEAGAPPTTTARPVAGYPEKGALDPEKLGVHDSEIFETGIGSRFVVVGRVGDKVHDVGASFDDWTWGKASMANGWYAIWWPGTQPALTIAASDPRSIVIDSFTP